MSDTTVTEAVDGAPADGGTTDEPASGQPETRSRGQRVVHATPDTYLDLVTSLRAEGFTMCIDVTAVDYLGDPARDIAAGIEPQRFEVVVNLLDMERRERVRIRVQVPAADPRVPSLFELYAGSEAMEREVFDLMGIVFDGHPDLTRILMPDDWEGHPLRKDYSMGRIPVQFKHPPATR